MQTLDEQNEQTLERYRKLEKEKYNSGVSCPKCGKEMEVESPGIVCASNPPCRWVVCRNCGYRNTQIL